MDTVASDLQQAKYMIQVTSNIDGWKVAIVPELVAISFYFVLMSIKYNTYWYVVV